MFDEEGFAALGTSKEKAADVKKNDPDIDYRIQEWMCKNFFDISSDSSGFFV